MKRILFFFASSACVLTGCTLEPAERLLSTQAPVFTASFETGATRTQLEDNQLSVLWSEGDEISVIDGKRANHAYRIEGLAGKTATFVLKGSEEVQQASSWRALYPYDPDAVWNGAFFTTRLLSGYSVSRTGTFAEGMNIAIAQSEGSSLSLPFKNVLGYIAVAVKGASDVTKLVFSGNNGETVSGPLQIEPGLQARLYGDTPDTKNLTLNIEHFEESASREDAKYYYIPVVPGGAFALGFSIVVTKGDGDYTFTYDQAVTFARGEKRALFIEIPGGESGEGNYVDLVNEPLLWVTQTASPDPEPANWDEKHRIYPSAHADLSYAEWTWNNGPEEVTYPEGYPALDVYSRRLRINRGIFDNDALVFNVPVAQIPAGKSLALTFALRGGSRMPKYWTVEASLDGSTWTAMTVTGEKEDSENISYEGRDGQTYIAPICITKKDSEHPYQATLPITTAISSQVIQIRVRVLVLRTIADALVGAPENNSNATVALPKFTFGEVNYPGPCISVL
ncbi:MAG: hypothetical protein IJ654_02875 [Bacteroidales bacterium]|nr:hypothetical protein [Bacteroidales bacterium]